MINSLRAENLMCLKDTGTLNFSRLNILVGPNNVGKSAALYAILLLKQTIEDSDGKVPLVTQGPYVELGGYREFIYGHTSRNLLAIELDVSFSNSKSKSSRTAGLSFRVEFRFDTEMNSIELERCTVNKPKTPRIDIRRKEDGTQQGVIPDKLSKYFNVSMVHFLPVYLPTTRTGPQEKVAFDDAIKYYRFKGSIANFTAFMQGVRCIGPIRSRIPKVGFHGTMPSYETGPSGENLFKVLSSSERIDRKTAIEHLKYWLEDRFKILRNVRIKPLGHGTTALCLVGNVPDGPKNVNLASMGTGISQLAPIVAQTVLTPPLGTLIIEQPEIHLHPAAEAEMAELFIEMANKERQFFIETHSEHFLLRVRRRVADGTLSPKHVRLFIFERRKGHTHISQHRVGQNGEVQPWPKGFFEEGYEESLAMLRANMRNKVGQRG